jgi:ketosteroid isomerase-like protein
MNTNRPLSVIAATIMAASLLAISSLQPLCAQTAASSPTASAASSALPDEESLHQELRGLRKTYEDAVNSGNLAPLAPAFGPQTSGVVATNEEFHTIAEMQDIFDRFKNTLGPGYTYRVKLNPELSLIYGDIAVARGTSDEYVKSHGHEFNLTTRWTAVLRRENGQWHLLRSQVSMDPFHNSVTNYFFASVKKIYGGVGLAIGLVVGLLLGYFTGRRKTA